MPNKNETTATEESKADKFKRLGSSRVVKATDAINGLTNLANKANYEYTDEQVAKISEALDTAVQNVKDAFAGKKAAATGFQL